MPRQKRRPKRLIHHPVMNALIGVALFVTIVPLVVLVMQCFLSRWTGIVPTAWTLRGVQAVIKAAPTLLPTTWTTLWIGLFTAVVTTIIGALVGRAMHGRKIKHRMLWQIFTILPILIPTTVCGVGMRNIFMDMSIANTLAAVMIGLVVVNVPYSINIMTEVTNAAGVKLEEEARMLGANPFKAYLTGTLPSVLPGVFTSMGFSFMMAVNSYFMIVFMSTGRVETLVTSVVLPAVQHSTMPVAAIYCVLFIVFTVVIFVIFQLLSNRATKMVGKNLGA